MTDEEYINLMMQADLDTYVACLGCECHALCTCDDGYAELVDD